MKMERVLLCTVCVFLSASILACSDKKASSAGADATGNAALVNGVPITMKQLDEASSDAMQRLSMEIFKIKERELNGLIEERLLETAAAAMGKSRDEFLAMEVDEKVEDPSESEIKAMYDARKDAYKQPYDQVKGDIANFLKQNKQARLYRGLITKLRAEADVKVFFEPPRVQIDVGNLPYLGEKNAPVTIVEFSDYQCPFCKRVRQTIDNLVEDYKGKVKYVFMDFPLSFHAKAPKAHEAARCAGDQDKYYEYNKKIFENQNAIDIPDLKKYARELKLNSSNFDKCLDGGKHAPSVTRMMEQASSAGVSGTPAFFINGIMLSGARPQSAFVEIIDAELAR
jgi:predicted DsbA family dithiol-disulfide isomerase